MPSSILPANRGSNPIMADRLHSAICFWTIIGTSAALWLAAIWLAEQIL